MTMAMAKTMALIMTMAKTMTIIMAINTK